MEFEWNENKNESNQKKHGIRFEEAKEVFNDSDRIVKPDNRKDYGEDRLITTGKVKKAVLTVVYTVRNAIRIISARFANKKERASYNNQKK